MPSLNATTRYRDWAAIRRLAWAAAVLLALVRPAAAQDSLLNVSYDPTRELYKAFNDAFARHWQSETGRTIRISTSNGGSGAQARAVLEGLAADVVTLAVASDIDALAAHGLLAKDWQTRLPDGSVPYTSTIVFLVRHGNPKQLRDWPDLVRPGVSVVTANPKTSGGARWAFLAALGWAMRQPGATEASEQAYMQQLFTHVPVLDSGSRGATTTFAQRGIGDVLLAWENEAKLARAELGDSTFDIIYPSVSILAEPPVAVVDSVVDRRASRRAAQAYLDYLYSPEGQELAAKYYYRPRDPAVLARHQAEFPAESMFGIDLFGGWPHAQAAYFADGGLFDRITAGHP
jgi:sulfate transport system substrate-binding protein